MIDIGCCGHTDSYLAISQMGYDYVELSAQQIMELTDEEFSEFLKLYKRRDFHVWDLMSTAQRSFHW